MKKTPDEDGDGRYEAQQNPERDGACAGMMWIGGAILRPAEHGEDYRLEEEQSEARSDSGDDQAALAHSGEHNEVQRDEQGGEGYGGAPGSGVDRCSENGSSVALASGEEVDRAMRDQQNQQGEQNAAGIETPG